MERGGKKEEKVCYQEKQKKGLSCLKWLVKKKKVKKRLTFFKSFNLFSKFLKVLKDFIGGWCNVIILSDFFSSFFC